MKLKQLWILSDTEWDNFLSVCLDSSWVSVWLDLSLSLFPCTSVSVQFVLQQVDISLPQNKMWFDRYRWDIPVFHLNGRFVMKHRADVMLLDRLLQDAETQNTTDNWLIFNKFLILQMFFYCAKSHSASTNWIKVTSLLLKICPKQIL